MRYIQTLRVYVLRSDHLFRQENPFTRRQANTIKCIRQKDHISAAKNQGPTANYDILEGGDYSKIDSYRIR